MGAITSFSGQYRFLSNFFPAEVVFDGVTYPTVEHAYQAAKTTNLHHRNLVRLCPRPGEAKRMGRKVALRPDWEEIKLDVMRDLLKQKFEPNSMFASQLLGTYPDRLVEGNHWGDTYWGECPLGTGMNMLGKLLEEIRGDLKKKSR